ncbi:MAG: amidohydrolase family protein [Candidatus Sulfotelmatobacter sp.]
MRAFACLLVAFVICGSMFAQVMFAQVTALRAGRLVDPDSGTVLSNQIVLISGNKILAVGPELTIPAEAKVIDLSDKTVLPGLIDCHTHVADGQSDGDPFNVLRKTASQIVLESVPNARNMLLSGFTTVRDVGTYRALNDIALCDAINRGDVIGPRLFVAGAYITITGGAGAITGQAPDIQLPWDLHYGEANGPWEVRQKFGCWRTMGWTKSRCYPPAQS